MTTKDIKQEARKKLALNMHQAIVIYTVEFTVLITLIALVVMSCVCLGVSTPAAIVMMCYGIVLGIIAVVACGMVNFALVDYYLATYRCKPYNIRRLGDTLARSNITKVLLLSLKRTLLAFLLLLCLIVPGVIYLIRTSMANYLLVSNPKMKASTALSASNKVMSGKTGSYFALCMSLIGWYLLGIVTLGLGFIFIKPYTNLIKAVYYKRNLQGDKTVYNTVVQPIVAYAQPDQPVQAGAQPVAAQPQAGGSNDPIIVPLADNAVQAEPMPAPIEAFPDEDLIDMQAAMRSFETPNAKKQPIDDIPEVPIAPITTAKADTDGKVNDDVIAVEPKVEKPTENDTFGVTDGLSRKIDGTDLVETERILTTQEIDLSDAAKRRAYAKISNEDIPNRPIVDYISAQSNQSSDDFMTVEADNIPSAGQASENVVVVPIDKEPENISDFDEPVMSDNEFAEFLRNFDGIPETEKEFKPLKRSEKADTNNRVENSASNKDQKSSSSPQDTARNAAANGDKRASDLMDRAARMRKEREERLNQINKK